MTRALSTFLVSILMCCAAAPDPPLRVTNIGRFDFTGGADEDPNRVAEGLSGIAYLGGDRYLAVTDRHPYLHRITVQIDPQSGAIQAASFGTPVQLKDEACRPFDAPEAGPDREGLAYDAGSESVWISNERTAGDEGAPSIARHSLTTGCLTSQLRVFSYPELRAFGQIRRNLGFESLTRDPGTGALWTANEEALPIDGPRASEQSGTVVRLQQFSPELAPLAQYAYLVDPLLAPRPDRGGLWASGLADLVALPGGRLLALERALGGVPPLSRMRIRLYEVHVASAVRLADASLTGGLEQIGYSPAPKTLLIELTFSLESNSNFEGVVLGPRLANGDYSLLLIADNNSGTQQSLYALRLGGAGPGN